MGQLEMVYAENVKQGCVEVVYVNRVMSGFPADVVCFPVAEAGFYPTASHEHGESVGMVIASGIGLTAWAIFAKGGASKFSSPDYKSLVEEAPFLEVSDQGGYRLVTHSGVKFKFAVEVGVLVP
tara:strand:- start:148 stop:519 length:372 start_codon:yes stop_codon:yes gene_type:complete